MVLLPWTQTNLSPDRQLFGLVKSFGRARISRCILLNRANISLNKLVATNIAMITQFHCYRGNFVAISQLRSLTRDHQHLNDIGVPAIAIIEEPSYGHFPAGLRLSRVIGLHLMLEQHLVSLMSLHHFNFAMQFLHPSAFD